MIDRLRADGICVLPDHMEFDRGDPGVEEFLTYLQDKPLFEGQVHRHDSLPWTPDMPVSCWRQDHVIRAPHFFEQVLKFCPLAEEYGCPNLYSVNCFTIHAGFPENPNIGEWHRDHDDKKMLALFMFCCWAFAYSAGTHKYRVGTHKIVLPDVEPILTVLGKPGTMWLEDPSGLHYASPKPHDRTLAWARWGVSDPPQSYAESRPTICAAKDLTCYPSDPKLQRAIRLVVR